MEPFRKLTKADLNDIIETLRDIIRKREDDIVELRALIDELKP